MFKSLWKSIREIFTIHKEVPVEVPDKPIYKYEGDFDYKGSWNRLMKKVRDLETEVFSKEKQSDYEECRLNDIISDKECYIEVLLNEIVELKSDVVKVHAAMVIIENEKDKMNEQ
jgi:hypothetical protein